MKVIIIGGGQVGAYIASLLLSNNCSVKVIESRESVLSKLRNELPMDIIVAGDGTDPNLLESCGIADADVVAAVTGADETNLVASTIAKFEFGVKRVIARVNNPKNSWMFNASMGVDVGLNQADLMAHLVVEEIDFRNLITLFKIKNGSHSIIQIKVSDDSNAVNKAVKDLQLSQKAVLFSIYRGNDVIIPHGDTVILKDDIVLAFTDENSKPLINDIFGK